MIDDEARPRRSGTTWLRYAIPIAAGAILVVLAPKFFSGRAPKMSNVPPGESEPALPSPVSPAEPSAPPPAAPSPAVVALFPFGTFAEPPPKFIWTRDPKATAYRLELMEESGNVFFSTETPETTFAFPADDLGWLRIGSWRVIPLTGASAGAPSDPVRVRIDPSLGQ